MIKSVYIHIPFCKKICSYCDFCKSYYGEEIVSKYIESLEKEINNKYSNEKLKTIYIGGGTPSSLSENALNKLFNVLKVFKLDNGYEYTFECNYEDITEELLGILIKNKVNRISIGIQTFNEKYGSVLNRNINKKNIIEKIELARKYFDNINVDLMYALPGESINDLKYDIGEFIKLGVNHISTYALIIENNTMLKINNVEEIDDDIQSEMYYLIVNELNKKGYKQYEISNFSKPGFESKHNLTYWNNNEYYGFGAGASGFIDKVRYDNTRSVSNYVKGNYTVRKEILDKNMLIKDEVMLNLRKTDGINLSDFYDKYNIDFDNAFNYNDLITKKLLIKENNHIHIPLDKLFISNEIIIMLLDTYLNDL